MTNFKASEMHNIAIDSLYNQNKTEYQNIMAIAEKEAKKGNFCAAVDSFSRGVSILLEESGFKITELGGDVKISW